MWSEREPYQPVRRQATFASHHSGILGRITITRSPLCKEQASVSMLANFLDKDPSSSKPHLTSPPFPSIHQKAGLESLPPAWGKHSHHGLRGCYTVKLYVSWLIGANSLQKLTSQVLVRTYMDEVQTTQKFLFLHAGNHVSFFCELSFLIYHENFFPKVRIYTSHHLPREVSILHFFSFWLLKSLFTPFCLKVGGKTKRMH